MSSSEWNEQKVGENVHLGKKQHIVYTQLFPFLSFGQRLLKSSHHLVLNRESQIQMKQSKVFHDEKQCMFLLRLDQKGTIAALCYLPTRVKKVIEVYHIEIPIKFRHRGVGDKLVKEFLDWAKESGTLVIPACNFVKRHLELFDYGTTIVSNEQEAVKYFVSTMKSA
ncbi:hypothetical protein A0J61_00633 [Choanephora cucurbitarum]|uniref:N-acetyltransferase domain-containing protein n=1 Tax=Choanephora cucurbitarum TaxID=101091 RepID=A0A1C7NQW7_9FUNG|nr:hypothetical protein A0J61_00633 [Choanephora cucurbitarum]